MYAWRSKICKKNTTVVLLETRSSSSLDLNELAKYFRNVFKELDAFSTICF